MATSSMPSRADDWTPEDGGLHEACGVFGCVAAGEWPTQLDIPQLITLGLTGLQHRGQESAGMITSQGSSKKYHKHKGMGMVSTIFTDEILAKLQGDLGIGHNRYSTAGASELLNCQPFDVETVHGRIAVAHNGELVNAAQLRMKVLKHGVGLSTGSDSEVITQMLTHAPPEGEPEGPNWLGRIRQLMNEALMAYSLLILHGSSIYAVRDPYGNRPLCIGRLVRAGHIVDCPKDDNVEGWVVSSESCSFQSIGAHYYREVLPGEIVEITKTGIKSLAVVPRPAEDPQAFCIFEYVYFSRPDTILEGQMVYSVRRRCGQRLAQESPVEADIVSTVPESATPAALGFSSVSGIPYMEVLTKNRYVGRTFIQPNQRLRQLGVSKKFGALTENFKGKRIIIIDDSIVRGTTIGPIIKLLKKCGAKEVHIRVASPPVSNPCYMGINIPTREELVANRIPVDRLASYFNADSIAYLSIEGLRMAVTEGMQIEESRKQKRLHCTACLSGEYPVKLEW
ncbi:amidophosphoribosyltransferase-like [Lytechinus variegatus]|uniref:amidophosphoribosyltransferase-like n=1 Tax=Lytechinus variegatus TaxID=7654 RepID=UPI001BB1F4DE|nr:amidophosphoribosyltransferase-like [Lytechinus variegatus]XP_041460446.1 amidophosphoribosyltransferase-like [Lytechinus variegatus]